jgi:hypothetical protein
MILWHGVRLKNFSSKKWNFENWKILKVWDRAWEKIDICDNIDIITIQEKI